MSVKTSVVNYLQVVEQSEVHVCKLAYVYVYEFKWGNVQYTRRTLLRCTGCEGEEMMVAKAVKKLPEYF